MLLTGSSIDYSGSDTKLGFQMWRLVGLWQKKLNAALKHSDLTHAQYLMLEAILWISQEHERVTQVDIARAVEIDPMMVSNLVRMLEKKDLIKRKNDKKDTRAKLLELTTKGHYLIKKVMPEVDKFDANFFSSIKVNNKQLAEMVDSLLSAEEE
jgi:MarR family transcriptional regulator, organic hydroperoxide resistance regulator